MQQIDSEEKVATPTAMQGPPPQEICVMIMYVRDGRGHRAGQIFHEDFPQGFDLDGAFRARVGVALSEALTKPPVENGER